MWAVEEDTVGTCQETVVVVVGVANLAAVVVQESSHTVVVDPILLLQTVAVAIQAVSCWD